MCGKFKSKVISIITAVTEFIWYINLNIPRKWLREVEENIPTIWSEARHVSYREMADKKHWMVAQQYHFYSCVVKTTSSCLRVSVFLKKYMSFFLLKYKNQLSDK